MMKKEVDMLHGPILKGLLTITIPIMLMNVSQTLFNVVDMTVLKIFDNEEGYAVGSVGACGTLIVLITGLVIGISAGSNVVTAKYIALGDVERTSRSVGSSILFSVVSGFVLLIIGILFAEKSLLWTNCPTELLDQAALYFRLYFLGAPLLMLYTFAAAIMRSDGDTKRPMIYLLISGIVKLLFNLLFVGAFGMGVTGAAFATLLSWTANAFLSMRALLKTHSMIAFRWKYLRFYPQELKETLVLGIPAGLQQGLYSIANVFIAATVNTFGPDATTGISIANQFDGILYQISIAPSLAVMPYVSQNIACGNSKRASRSVWIGTAITIALGASFGALSAIFAPQLSSLMTSSQAAIDYSCQKMYIISSTYFICGIDQVIGSAVRGMGKSVIPTITTLIYMCFFRFVWVYFIFPILPTLTFLYLVWPISWVLSILTLLPFYFPTLKRSAAKAAAKAAANC